MEHGKEQVWEQETYRKLQGTYPVIFLSFASIKSGSYKEMLTAINMLVTELYDAYEYLLEGDFLKKNEREQFLSVRIGKVTIEQFFGLGNGFRHGWF